MWYLKNCLVKCRDYPVREYTIYWYDSGSGGHRRYSPSPKDGKFRDKM